MRTRPLFPELLLKLLIRVPPTDFRSASSIICCLTEEHMTVVNVMNAPT
jgi:hypothetical protein